MKTPINQKFSHVFSASKMERSARNALILVLIQNTFEKGTDCFVGEDGG